MALVGRIPLRRTKPSLLNDACVSDSESLLESDFMTILMPVILIRHCHFFFTFFGWHEVFRVSAKKVVVSYQTCYDTFKLQI
jgi:hypothetical protein